MICRTLNTPLEERLCVGFNGAVRRGDEDCVLGLAGQILDFPSGALLSAFDRNLEFERIYRVLADLSNSGRWTGAEIIKVFTSCPGCPGNVG